MLISLLTFLFVGLIGLLAVGVVFAVVGLVFSVALGVAGILLFKVLPIVLVGWLILKLVQRRGSRGTLSSADRRWLDGGD